MGAMDVAQQALDKAKSLTFGPDQQKVISFFQQAGFTVSPSGQVQRTPPNADEAFAKVYKALSALPVAKLGVKRVLGQNGINV